MDESAAMHAFDQGVLIVGVVFLALSLWGILDAPRRKDGEGCWRRRVAAVAAFLGGGYLVIAAWRFVAGFLLGSSYVARLGARVTPGDWARAGIDCLVPAGLASVTVLAALLGAWSVTTACRRGRLHAILETAALVLVTAVTVVAINGGLPGGRDRRSMGFLPDYCIPGLSEELLAGLTGILFPFVTIALFMALFRSLRTPAEGESRESVLSRVLATGTFAAAFFLLRTNLLVMAVLRNAGVLGPKLPGPLPAFVRAEVLRSPLTLSMAGLSLIAVALGLSALRLRREQADAVEEGGAQGSP